MGTNTETHSQILCKNLEYTAPMGCLHQIPSLRAHGTLWKKRGKECKSQKAWKTPRNQSPLISLNKARTNSQRLKQLVQGLHRSAPGPLCIYYDFQFSVFMRSLSMQMSGPLRAVPFLGLFTFCLFFSNCNVLVFYFILLSLRRLFIFFFFLSFLFGFSRQHFLLYL